MSGDWIKIEHWTQDKPEVFVMADELGIDPDAVLGKLVRIWVWADQQTFDGNAVSVTFSLLDRVSGQKGFANAMLKAGWLKQVDDGVQFVNFDRHNGETAKTRALTAKRVKKHRTGNAATPQKPLSGNATSVTLSLPEKRREEKNRNKETHSVSADTEIFFENFWTSYPRKTGKGGARKAFLKAIKTHEPEKIIQGAKQFASTNKSDPEFTPHPATWLNQERWADEPLEPPKKKYQPFAWQEEQERRLRDGEISQAQFNAIILAKMHERD